MRNARVFNERITIGGVPDHEDLVQLKRLGYRTLVDLREAEEKFGGLVEKKAVMALALRYIAIPIQRAEINMADVTRFYDAVHEEGNAPVYAFSRFGKKPLAFLLLFEAAAAGDPFPTIFRQAGRFGLNIEGDLALREFLIGIYNAGDLQPVLDAVRKHRPDLLVR